MSNWDFHNSNKIPNCNEQINFNKNIFFFHFIAFCWFDICFRLGFSVGWPFIIHLPLFNRSTVSHLICLKYKIKRHTHNTYMIIVIRTKRFTVLDLVKISKNTPKYFCVSINFTNFALCFHGP